MHSDKIQRQIEFIEKNPKYGLIYSDFSLINADNNVIENIIVPEWDFSKWIRSGGFICFSTVMVKKQHVVDVGSFDESLQSNEDLDLLMKLSKITSFSRCEGVLSVRRIHSNNLSKNVIITLFARSKLFFKNSYYLLSITSFIGGLLYSYLFYFGIQHPKFWRYIRAIHKSLGNS
jgi:hypothetical protein